LDFNVLSEIENTALLQGKRSFYVLGEVGIFWGKFFCEICPRRADFEGKFENL